MTQIPAGGKAAHHHAGPDPAWHDLQVALADYLLALPQRCDHEPVANALVLEAPTAHLGDEPPCARLWFDGSRLNAAVRGGSLGRGWEIQRLRADAPEMAGLVVGALRDTLELPHPQLLTHVVTGPADDLAADLGLTEAQDVEAEPSAPTTTLAAYPTDAAHLRSMLGATLCSAYGDKVTTDDDGDFVITIEAFGQPINVWVPPGEPCVRLSTRVVHGVHSRRAAAIELSLLNRDAAFVSFFLVNHREVIMRLDLPAAPFVEDHLLRGLSTFLAALTQTQADLALRTGGGMA